MVEKCQNLRTEIKARSGDSVNLLYWGHIMNKSRRSYVMICPFWIFWVFQHHHFWGSKACYHPHREVWNWNVPRRSVTKRLNIWGSWVLGGALWNCRFGLRKDVFLWSECSYWWCKWTNLEIWKAWKDDRMSRTGLIFCSFWEHECYEHWIKKGAYTALYKQDLFYSPVYTRS